MLNKVILMGRLCADPEFRQTPSGTATCRIRIAVNRQFVNKQTGERETDFINVTCWRQTAEFVSRYFHWTDQNGVKHYSMDVQADNVSFGESKNAAQGGGYGQQNNGGYQATYQQPNYSQPAAAPAPQAAPQQSVQLGDLGDFEEILSDGEVPF